MANATELSGVGRPFTENIYIFADFFQKSIFAQPSKCATGFCALFLKVHLGRRNRRLEVVAVEVALEVEVREYLVVLNTEKRLELGVRLNRVLVLEVVRLDVRRDGLRHV